MPASSNVGHLPFKEDDTGSSPAAGTATPNDSREYIEFFRSLVRVQPSHFGGV